jgi:hypothetical protein
MSFERSAREKSDGPSISQGYGFFGIGGTARFRRAETFWFFWFRQGGFEK